MERVRVERARVERAREHVVYRVHRSRLVGCREAEEGGSEGREPLFRVRPVNSWWRVTAHTPVNADLGFQAPLVSSASGREDEGEARRGIRTTIIAAHGAREGEGGREEGREGGREGRRLLLTSTL